MRPTSRDPMDTALEPVRAELLRAAQADAERIRTAAAEEATAIADRAAEIAHDILASARSDGRTRGEALARDLLTRARQEARARVLAARQEALTVLRTRVAERLPELRASPEYPRRVELLRQRARSFLGDEATVTEHPDGGVVGWAQGRYTDLRLSVTADRALARLGTEVRALWTP